MVKDIQLLVTGGTIDSEYDIRTYSTSVLKESSVKKYIENYIRPDIDIQEEVISLVDSRDMNDDIRESVFQNILKSKSNNIIITHGTATLVETAQYLKNKIAKCSPPPQKKIILLGSFYPLIFYPTDAPFNLGFAIGVIEHVKPGVYIAMNSKLFDISDSTGISKDYNSAKFRTK
ncbi:MAG: asparaginase [Firmicutes bacterium]|nr:asparaginase [Bacillota bacterium]